MPETVLLPSVPETIYEQYKSMREASRTGLAYGVLPSARNALAVYAVMEAALNDSGNPTFGDYRAEIKAHHETRIALVAPYITQMQQLMAGLLQIAEAIDAASIANGDVSVFNSP